MILRYDVRYVEEVWFFSTFRHTMPNNTSDWRDDPAHSMEVCDYTIKSYCVGWPGTTHDCYL